MDRLTQIEKRMANAHWDGQGRPLLKLDCDWLVWNVRRLVAGLRDVRESRGSGAGIFTAGRVLREQGFAMTANAAPAPEPEPEPVAPESTSVRAAASSLESHVLTRRCMGCGTDIPGGDVVLDAGRCEPCRLIEKAKRWSESLGLLGGRQGVLCVMTAIIYAESAKPDGSAFSRIERLTAAINDARHLMKDILGEPGETPPPVPERWGKNPEPPPVDRQPDPPPPPPPPPSPEQAAMNPLGVPGLPVGRREWTGDPPPKGYEPSC